MKRMVKLAGILLLAAAFAWCGTVLADRQRLNRGLIRMHVVANSDSVEDQQVKLLVKDEVNRWLQANLPQGGNTEEVLQWLRENTAQLERVAREVLNEAGAEQRVCVEVKREGFATKSYETFSLPAGVYEAVRITLGDGEGENWWCVVFPSLCLPATGRGFSEVAAGAGFPDSLSCAMEGKQGYEVRFFVLDCLGYLEKMFFKG